MSALARARDAVAHALPMRVIGVVAELRGMMILVHDLPLPAGALVSIRPMAGVLDLHHNSPPNASRAFGEVVGFTREHALVMLLGQTVGIRPGDAVVGEEATQTALVGESLLGRVVNGLGTPLDALGPVPDRARVPLNPDPIIALARRRIDAPLHTGVRSLDLMTTLGRGQRLGLFAGPGVGKSTLMGTIAQRSDADVNVIALIGERGREVKDFLDHALGPKGRARSVVVVATGDESPVMRVRAAKYACAAAEHFRALGRDVLLMMDSATRFAHAQRQIGLSVGEPPATKGYTPSVFAQLALLLERAGALEAARPDAKPGSITGLYTILVEGDDMTEPVADAARGILDGHVVLSRRLAQRGHFPAVDVLDSVSRVIDDVTDQDHRAARRQVIRLLAKYAEIEDLVQIGAYARGSDPEADVAIDAFPRIEALLRQGKEHAEPFDAARQALLRIARETADAIAATRASARGSPQAPRPTRA